MGYLTQWSFDPFLIVVALVVAAHERGLARLAARSRSVRNRQRRRRAWLFYAGLALLLLAVVSPIDYWADDYFFVHMVEHILLMFFAPMLIVAGAPWLPLVHAVPVGTRRRVGRAVLLGAWARPLRSVGRFCTSGAVAVVVFNVVMVFWHLPGPFDLAENNQLIHIWLMHGSFFVAGVAFWLQIVPSYPIKPKLSAVGKIGAILGTNVVMTFLAMALSILASQSWYPVYDHLVGVRLSPFVDQQIGAAILWVCGDFWALPALVKVIRDAVVEEGSASALVDRFFHRPAWAVDGQRTGTGPSR
ncbi:MAG: cytochrome c oxidase assembly protein [Acidimicrobiales bacterium]